MQAYVFCSNIRYWGKWSDIPIRKFPEETLYFEGEKKVLSIRVLEVAVTLVGNEILGKRKEDSNVSTKFFTESTSLKFKRLMLKSPNKTSRLFSLLIC